MLDPTFLIDLIGSLILVTGSAWPDKKVHHPGKSAKNWFFEIGALFMLAYSVLNYWNGGQVFFIFLQVFANISGIMMLAGVKERISTPLVVLTGLGMIIWSLTLLEDLNTTFFILGLCGVSLGYVMTPGTFRRNLALTIGSLLIALFSYITATWIFFWLNIFFAIFSAYYAWKLRK